jgi:hypothetical protein
MAVHDITSYGAVSGSANNTAAVQAAVDAAVAGDDILIPAGVFTCRKATSIASVLVNKRLNWTGTGSLEMANDEAMIGVPFGNSHATLYVSNGASGSTFSNFSMNGNKDGAGGPTEYVGFEQYEHHRGIFFNEGCTDVVFNNVSIRNYTGDAVQLYNDCRRFQFLNCTMEWCQRDHITLSPFSEINAVYDVLIDGCTLRGASNQQVDNEHGPAHNVTVRNCTLEFANNLLSIGLVIAGSGFGVAWPSRNWLVHNNTISGAMRFTWTSGSKIYNNVFTNPRQVSTIELERGQHDNEIYGNTIVQTQNAVSNLAGIYINGSEGGGAARINIHHNDITVSNRAQSFGVRGDGIVNMTTEDNTITGPGLVAAGYSGVRARTSVADREMEHVIVNRNVIKNWGQNGVSVAGPSVDTGRLRYIEVMDNQILNDSGTAMTRGVYLVSSTLDVFSATVVGNTYGAGVVTPLTVGPECDTVTNLPIRYPRPRWPSPTRRRTQWNK